MVAFMKGPVRLLEELYERYPLGGREGDVALVTRAFEDEAGWAYWHEGSREWRLMAGGGGDRFEVSPGSLSFSANGGVMVVHVLSNLNYTVMADDWLGLSSTSGSGDGSVQVTASENLEGTRTGQVLFTSSKGDVQKVTVSQAAKLYSLSYGALVPANSGTQNTSMEGDYPYGTSVTLVATPFDHWGFTRWESFVSTSWVTLGTTANYSLTITGTTTVRAVFARTEYQVTTGVDDPQKGSVTAGAWVAAGGSKIITATPTVGNVFVEWNDANTDNPRTLSNIQEDISLTALFGAGSLEVSPTSLSFSAAGETKAVGVLSDIDWTVSVEYDD
jgi:hypothetical protein